MESLWIVMSLALGLAAGQPASAQESKAGPQPSLAQTEKAGKDTPKDAAPAKKAKDADKGKPKVDRDDRQFIQRAARAGLAEVEAGKLAASKASSGEVKKFAQQMVDDHSKANQELEAIASRLGVEVPAAPDKGHARDLKKLQELSGEKFDRRYMHEAGVEDHGKVVKLFRKAQKDVKDPDLKAFVDKTLPVVEKHHDMARSVEASLKGQKGESSKGAKDEKAPKEKRGSK